MTYYWKSYHNSIHCGRRNTLSMWKLVIYPIVERISVIIQNVTGQWLVERVQHHVDVSPVIKIRHSFTLNFTGCITGSYN